jgi:hypothetical protein
MLVASVDLSTIGEERSIRLVSQSGDVTVLGLDELESLFMVLKRSISQLSETMI